mmetsp:Transcript_33131/g.77532  ORF Transcript_33131/g.77532 Transcript_33131/m.77532 type:complete len:211 (+) Transcript_33131:917-1549(+)
MSTKLDAMVLKELLEQASLCKPRGIFSLSEQVSAPMELIEPFEGTWRKPKGLFLPFPTSSDNDARPHCCSQSCWSFCLSSFSSSALGGADLGCWPLRGDRASATVGDPANDDGRGESASFGEIEPSQTLFSLSSWTCCSPSLLLGDMHSADLERGEADRNGLPTPLSTMMYAPSGSQSREIKVFFTLMRRPPTNDAGGSSRNIAAVMGVR